MPHRLSKSQLSNYIAIVIVLVWAIISLASVITKEYTPLYAVNGVMMIVAGFLFASKNGKK